MRRNSRKYIKTESNGQIKHLLADKRSDSNLELAKSNNAPYINYDSKVISKNSSL
jgi:hypothetical protein